MKKWFVFVLQCLVTLGLLGWIFRDPEFRREVLEALSGADRGWLLAAALVAGAGCLMGILRWGIFLRVLGIDIPRLAILRIGAVGLFFNSFLPGVVGGDAVKAGWLVARGFSARSAVLSAVMDRISGLGALVLCSAVLIPMRYTWLMQSPAVSAMVHLLVIYLVVVSLLLSLSFVLSARGAVSRLPQKMPGRQTIEDFAAAYGRFLSCWKSTLAAALISVGMLLAYFLTFYLSARAFGVEVLLLDFLSFMPLVDLLAALPVSVGGFGVREAAFVTLLGDLAGVPAARAVSISFLGALVTLLWGCAGLILLPGLRKAR